MVNPILLDTVAAIAATTSKTITVAPGSIILNGVLVVNVTAITGTWTITAEFDVEGTAFAFATTAALTAVGAVAIAPVSGVPGIVRPTQVTYTEDVAGTLSAKAYIIER